MSEKRLRRTGSPSSEMRLLHVGFGSQGSSGGVPSGLVLYQRLQESLSLEHTGEVAMASRLDLVDEDTPGSLPADIFFTLVCPIQRGRDHQACASSPEQCASEAAGLAAQPPT
jgi:hypothetical protein